MKLDERGWGLSVFLGFVVVLILCIVVAGVNAYKVGLSADSPNRYFEKEISTTPTPTPTPSLEPTVPVEPTPTPTPTPTPNSVSSVVSDIEVESIPMPSSTPGAVSQGYNMIELRQDVTQAAGLYKKEYCKTLTEGQEVTVSFKRLIQYNYLPSTSIGPCTGYVKIKRAHRNTQFISYLNCPGYVSDGYQMELDEK